MNGSELGSVGLMGAVVVPLVGLMVWLVKRLVTSNEETRKEFMEFLGNHMSKNTTALVAVEASLVAVQGVLARICDRIGLETRKADEEKDDG